MGVSAVYGLPGRGKSHFGLFYSVLLSNKYKKPLVLNFKINPLALALYCKFMGYTWLFENLSDNLYFIDVSDDPCSALYIPNSIIFVDEAGIFYPAREHYNTPKLIKLDKKLSKITDFELQLLNSIKWAFFILLGLFIFSRIG